MKRFRALCIAGALGLGAGAAQAAPIPVFSTGVNGSGALLAGQSADPHWSWVSEPGGAVTTGPYVTDPSGFNFNNGSNTWVANTATSQWISPQPIYYTPPTTPNTDPPGSYAYTQTFSMAGLDPSSATITGQFAVDDTTTSLTVNGTPVSIAAGGYTAFTTFSIPAADLNGGSNVIVWTANNIVLTQGDPTGLQVDFITATANPLTTVPLPPAVVIVPLGAALAVLGSRRKMCR